MKIKIRAALRSDRPAIKRLIALFPKHLLQKNLPRMADFIVAECQDEIVGCCALAVYSKKIAEVRSLAVDPAFRNKSIATKLVKVCLTRVKRMKIQEVLAITGRPSLFERLGFKTFHKERIALFRVFKI